MRPLEEDESSDDSDVLEVAIIPRKNNTTFDGRDSPRLKRRKSSPQMDPMPSYTPTPLHILEQRARIGNSEYVPTPISVPSHRDSPEPDLYQPESYSRSAGGYSHDDYTPLLKPSPSVVGRSSSSFSEPGPSTTRTTQRAPVQSPTTSRPKVPATSANAIRPVSSALAQAVSRQRRNSQQEKLSAQKPSPSKVSTTTLTSASVEEPVLWTPQLPSQIKPVNIEDDEKYTSPRMVKQRVAHKPVAAIQGKIKGKPRVPLGVAKKVPSALRIRYLDVIINEYLATGHPPEESYQEALREEHAIANRAANKSIYINLVAGLKKKLREKAGVSTLPQDNDPKFINGNKVISHSEILTGKVTGTFSIERKRKSSDPSELNEYELYDRLSRYIVPVEQLEAYGYPSRDPDEPSLRKVPLAKDGQKQTLRSQLAEAYTCERCAKIYRVDEDGMPLPTTGKCIYHPGHLWNERINRSLEKRYSCCKGDSSTGGCSSNPYHVHKGELELTNFQGYVETQPKPDNDPNRHGIYALDCEMCYTTFGLELTRVTVINYKSDVVYEKLVKPLNQILDYNTKFSGINEGDLDEVKTTLHDVQKDLLKMFSSKTILIGHSLDSDMKALKMFHKRFIDTAQLFPHKRGLPYKRALRTLMVENLRVIIQEDVGHDSKEDASAALRLVMWKAKTDVPEKIS